MNSMAVGPDLPVGLRYPCTCNINSSHTFILGQSLTNANLTFYGFLYDVYKTKWTELSLKFDLAKPQKVYHKLSCALLKHENHVMVSFDANIFALNLTSLSLIKFDHKVSDGVIFNSDPKQNVIYYIGQHFSEEKTSIVYMVQLLPYLSLAKICN